MKTLLTTLLLVLSLAAWADQSARRMAQATESVALTDTVDLYLTSSEPFAPMGSVDIQNDHAVVIVQEIKPTRVLRNWMTHIFIDGQPARDSVNCQVKMFGRGTIILPYGRDFRPLTCYTEPDLQGTACSDYTEGHNGTGFMKALTPATLDNQIRSFRLRRGYMVTFALGLEGWGWSRCYIADMEDLTVNLPANMQGRVSSYRLFRWQQAKKGNLASSEYKYLDLVNATAGFDWGQGHNLLPDMECVANHIYEDFPSVETIGRISWGCHSKNNNEPGNSADDSPQTVETVLNNWQRVMRTGLRVCSESSHDGSMGHLQAFLDSVDARGWRCDIIDMHCYWPQGSFDGLTNTSKRYGDRPIWISEWLWGAWWSKNGIFAQVSDPNDFSLTAQQKLLDGTRPILEKLNANPRVERYFYWNAEARTSLWSKDGADTLSLLGKYFAHMNEPLAFNRKYEYAPRVVYRPSTNLTAHPDADTTTVTLLWDDPNGDMLDSMVVECRRPGATDYTPVGRIPLQDCSSMRGAAYRYQDTPPNGTNKYRVAIYPVGQRQALHSNSVTTLVISEKAVWDDVTDEYLTNAGFDLPADYTPSIGTGRTNHKAVTGWQTTSDDANGCSAVMQLGSGNTLNGQSVPQRGHNGKATGGALGMNQGWGARIAYTQTTRLPAGTYRMSYAVTNVKNASDCQNLTGYQTRGMQETDNMRSPSVGEWTLRTLAPFTLTEAADVTLTLGYTSPGGKSTSCPYYFFDFVRLERADLSQVDDAGYETVYLDVTDSLLRNAGFDRTTDFQKANVAKGTHKTAYAWAPSTQDANGAGAVFGIGSGYTLNGQPCPATNADGQATGGALGINQGWGVESYYRQTAKLPAGTYRMSYAVTSTANPAAMVASRCGYKIGTAAAVYDGLTQVGTGAWETHTLEDFTLPEAGSVTFTLGYQAANGTSGSNPYLFFDYIRLERAMSKDEFMRLTPVASPSAAATPVAIYDLAGRRLPAMAHGIYIIRYSDGTTRKVRR